MTRTSIALRCSLLLAGCTHAANVRPAVASVSHSEEGEASFYAANLEGQLTASGEPYRGERLTCAHRTHPFGAALEVTHLENGRTVKVTVTDRGPFVRGRIVDLSAAAARELGMLERGVAPVRVTLVR